MNILIVDDSLTSKMFIRKCIEMTLAKEQNINCLTAANGEEAIGMVEGTPIDLIISDVNMPVMSGRVLLKNLKESKNYSHIPIMMVTSISNGEHVKELMAMGALAVLGKPVNPTKFAEALGSVVLGKTAGTGDESWG